MNVMGFEKNQMDGIGKGEGRCLLGRYGNFLHIALLLKTEDCLGGPSSINFFTRISVCRSPMYLGVGGLHQAPASGSGLHLVLCRRAVYDGVGF